MSRLVMGREWVVTLNLSCACCEATSTATVSDVAAFGSIEGVKRTLRYQGWHINRSENICPACAGPIPKCPVCGALTPEPYALKGGEHYNGGHAWTCQPCQRAALLACVARSRSSRAAGGAS